MIKYKIDTFNDYLMRTTKQVEQGKFKSYSISTMNIFARPGSMIEDFLIALHGKRHKVYYDDTMSRRVYILPDGHYVWKILPRIWRDEMLKRESDKISESTKSRFKDILVDLKPRYFQIKTDAGLFKRFASFHPLQFLGTSHFKAAVEIDKRGSHSVTILTGELSSESDQNNLALTLETRKGYDFVKKILNPNYKIGQRLHETCHLTKKISLTVDYGDRGVVGKLPLIHQIAEDLIKDSPTNVILVSQYNPSGRLLGALNKIARAGARVTVPLEPPTDYRRKNFGLGLLFLKFKIKVSRMINLPDRPVASHVKCLIIKHVGECFSMMFGSDNFESWSDTYYRNTELSLVIKKVKKGDDGYEMIQKMLNKLVETQEITADERALLA